MTIAYDSPSSIKTFLEAEGLAMSKRFGQNFLVDRQAREKLYTAMGLLPEALVWEIGPGIGSITNLLLEHKQQVLAFEIDHGFIRVLKRFFGDNPLFHIVEGDFLKTWRGAFDTVNKPDLIFGNLPYNAALGIIADLLENMHSPPRMVFTVQKEAARRIAAVPGSKDYSAFSVLCASVCNTKILYDIGAAAFWPQPRVTSSVVVLTPRPDPIAAQDRKGFSRFVRAAFSSRRKTLRNNIAALDKTLPPKLDTVLERLGIEGGIRAEALTPSRLAEVFEALYSQLE